MCVWFWSGSAAWSCDAWPLRPVDDVAEGIQGNGRAFVERLLYLLGGGAAIRVAGRLLLHRGRRHAFPYGTLGRCLLLCVLLRSSHSVPVIHSTAGAATEARLKSRPTDGASSFPV